MKKLKSQPISFHYENKGNILELLDELNELLLDISPTSEIDLDIDGKLTISIEGQSLPKVSTRPYNDDIEALLNNDYSHFRKF